MGFSGLGIDFGTSNTLIAGWDADSQQVLLTHIPEYSRCLFQDGDNIPLIPSLIHYSPEGQVWIGNQVLQQGLANSRFTLRWMKQYILSRSPIRIRIEDHEITPTKAAQDFLSTLLTFLREEQGIIPRKIAFSAPVESFEFYTNWLRTLSENHHLPEVSWIDEPIAAAIGYELEVKPGSIFFVFDFGGGTMNAAMVIVENELSAKNQPLCRVLGKAGKNLGGMRIDQWLYQETLLRFNLSEELTAVRQYSTHILTACEKLKQALSHHHQATTGDILLGNGLAVNLTLKREEFEKILDRNHLFGEITLLFRNVLHQAYERGYSQDQITSVLMVGGSSMIPAIQQHVRQYFKDTPVHVQRPLDAVARGAALFVGGMGILDHIRHDYAIRYLDPVSHQYAFQKIVSSGTAYPTPQPVSRLTIKPTFEGQNKLGLAIFEIRNPLESSFFQENLELIFDPQGSARIVQLSSQKIEERTCFFVNEHCPTFLTADPPSEPGLPRFEISFSIDSQKRLTITARDLQTGVIILDNHPVIRLS
ncbi:MAG: Hsp70 family protein [Chloroflexota bacterium]|nr:MAG: molecular chaperone DnaK [Bellilinea sp.]